MYVWKINEGRTVYTLSQEALDAAAVKKLEKEKD
jgi:hypothetical protein